jgi:hypothetical protein
MYLLGYANALQNTFGVISKVGATRADIIHLLARADEMQMYLQRQTDAILECGSVVWIDPMVEGMIQSWPFEDLVDKTIVRAAMKGEKDGA